DSPLPRVMLLTRVGCHLCGVARETVASVCASSGADWREVDVDGDGELRDEYGDQVPVVLVDGEQVAALEVDATTLAAALRGGVCATVGRPITTLCIRSQMAKVMRGAGGKCAGRHTAAGCGPRDHQSVGEPDSDPWRSARSRAGRARPDGTRYP